MGASLYSFLQSEFFKTGGTALTKERRQELHKLFFCSFIFCQIQVIPPQQMCLMSETFSLHRIESSTAISLSSAVRQKDLAWL